MPRSGGRNPREPGGWRQAFTHDVERPSNRQVGLARSAATAPSRCSDSHGLSGWVAESDTAAVEALRLSLLRAAAEADDDDDDDDDADDDEADADAVEEAMELKPLSAPACVPLTPCVGTPARSAERGSEERQEYLLALREHHACLSAALEEPSPERLAAAMHSKQRSMAQAAALGLGLG